MNDDITLNIIGLEEVQKLLSSLPNEVSSKIQMDLLMKGAQIAKKDLESAAAANEGNNDKPSGDKLSANVVIKRDSKSNSVNIGFKKKVWYVKLIERGTAVRETKAGANRGAMQKKPFVSQSHDESVPKILDFLTKNFLGIIDKAIKKQLKRVK